MVSKEISRRSFVKWAAAVGGASALGGSLLSAVGCSSEPVTAGSSSDGFLGNVSDAVSDGLPYGADKIVPVLCTCGDACGQLHTANAYVKDGVIVYYDGNDHGNNEGGLCGRGMSGLEIINSPNRAKYPMRRTNEKGIEGTFERITWEEALDAVSSAMVKAIKETGPRSVAFGSGGSHLGNFVLFGLGGILPKLFGFNGAGGPTGCWSDLRIGPTATFGDMFHPLEHDPWNAKLIVFWGDNCALTKPQEWSDSFALAKYEHGATFVSIEPRISETSQQSDMYIPVRPGTDSYVAMAMANVIINEGLQDQEFIDKYTIGYEDFKKVALRYTPELVEEISWAPADKIRQLARMYATTKPAMMAVGRGGNQTGGTNSDAGWMMGRAIACLVALCGQMSESGNGFCIEASVGGFNGCQYHWYAAECTSYPPSKVNPLITPDVPGPNGVFDTSAVWMEEDPYTYKVYMTHGNGAGSWGNYGETVEAFKKLDFQVTYNRIINWTGSAFSDVILPACSSAETYCWRMDWEYSVSTEPAIEPMFECKSDYDIYRLVALAVAEKLELGVSEEEVWPWKSEKAFLEDLAFNEKFKGRLKERVEEGKFVERFAPFADGDIDYVISQSHGMPNPYFAGQLDFVPYHAKDYVSNGAPADDPEALWFPTDGGNGKALFRADFLKDASLGELPALPIPCEPIDSYYADGNPIESGNWELSDAVKNGYTFVAVGKAHEHWQFLSMNQDTDGGPGSRLLREAFEKASHPMCLLNPADAEKLGLEKGDKVTIESLYGKIEDCGVVLTQTVMPSTVVPPIHWAPAQTSLYPYSLSLGRLDHSVRNLVMPPLMGPYSYGAENRQLGGGQNCQSAVLCKIYKA